MAFARHHTSADHPRFAQRLASSGPHISDREAQGCNLGRGQLPDDTSAVDLRVGGGLGMIGGSGLGCAVRTGNRHVVVLEDGRRWPGSADPLCASLGGWRGGCRDGHLDDPAGRRCFLCHASTMAVFDDAYNLPKCINVRLIRYRAPLKKSGSSCAASDENPRRVPCCARLSICGTTEFLSLAVRKPHSCCRTIRQLTLGPSSYRAMTSGMMCAR